jgi:hypothetical protein
MDLVLTMNALWRKKMRITASTYAPAVLTYLYMLRSSGLVFLVLLAFFSTCSAGRAPK